MEFGRAVATAFAAGSNRPPIGEETDGAELISWNQGVIGIVILALVQAALFVWSGAGSLGTQMVLDISLVTFVALAFPFLLFALVARLRGLTSRLPATFLHLGITLSILQLVSALLTSFGVGQSGVALGLLFGVMFLAARGLLQLGGLASAGIALLVVAGFIGSNFLLLILPSGHLLN